MKYTGIELLWLFLLYSFLGWTLETAAGTIETFCKQRIYHGSVLYGLRCGSSGDDCSPSGT